MIVSVNASAFVSDSLNDTLTDPTGLLEARWQSASDVLFTTDLTDTWYQTVYLGTFSLNVEVGEPRYVRVQYRDTLGETTWSDALLVSVPPPPLTDFGSLYVGSPTEDGSIGWSAWAFHETAEVIAIASMDIPGRGPVLMVVVRRPSGVFIEYVTLTETEA